jgi:hypothetical protein
LHILNLNEERRREGGEEGKGGEEGREEEGREEGRGGGEGGKRGKGKEERDLTPAMAYIPFVASCSLPVKTPPIVCMC